MEDDCDDLDAAVLPGELEWLGDSFDSDCDGGTDSAVFQHGEWTFAGPMGPVLAHNDSGFVLAIAADEVVEPFGTSSPDAGVALVFDDSSGPAAQPHDAVFWQQLNAEPLAGTIDLVAATERFHVAFTYAKQSGGIDRQWLFVRELTAVSTTWSQRLLYSAVDGAQPSSGVDLVRHDDGSLWVAGCADGVLHVMASEPDATGSHNEVGDGQAELAFGSPCALEQVGSDVIASSERASAHLDLPSEQVVPVALGWTATGVLDVRTRGDLTVFALGADGVVVERDGTSTHWLDDGSVVVSADAWRVGSQTFVAAVVEDLDGDGLRDVVLAYDEVVSALPYPADQNPEAVTVYATADRLAVAVSSSAVASGDDGVGWLFLGR